MAATVARVMEIHRTQLGYAEPGWNDVPGSQVTKYGNWYAAWARQAAYRDTYWCAMYQSWVLDQAGFSIAETGRFGNCNPWIAWLKKHGMWHAVPRPGALVFFDWNGDGSAEHIGMVEVVRADGRIQTIEGNASIPGRHDGVRRMIRKAAILGYGHLPYAAPPAAAPPAVVTRAAPLTAPAGAKGSPSQHLPNPVPIGAPLGTADARGVPWGKCPQMAPGFGGPESTAQAAWAAYWFVLMGRWSPGYFKLIMGSRTGRVEVTRREIGPVTIAVTEQMVHQVNPKAPSFRGVIPPLAWSLYQPT